MKGIAHILFIVVAVAGLVYSLAGCTVKATTKTTTDVMTNFLSSTSGKSWLSEDGLVKRDLKVKAFAAVNFENLKRDMAQGHGEYLSSLGTLLGVPGDSQEDFSTLAREKYPVLIPSDRTTPGEMLTALAREMSTEPTLKQTPAE